MQTRETGTGRARETSIDPVIAAVAACRKKGGTFDAATGQCAVGFLGLPYWAWGLIAAGGVAVVGGGVYFATRKGRR